ncbi:unnamed protein product, partial [Ostreobium quekettii]
GADSGNSGSGQWELIDVEGVDWGLGDDALEVLGLHGLVDGDDLDDDEDGDYEGEELAADAGDSIHSGEESTDDGTIVGDGELHCTGPGYLLPQYRAYPATSSSNHHQVSDALCCKGGCCRQEGGEEVVMYTHGRMRVARLPEKSGQDLQTLAEVDLETRPHSVDRTPDGRSIAVGGQSGIITIFDVEDDKKASSSSPDEISRVLDPRVQNSGLVLRHKAVFMLNPGNMVNSLRYGIVAGRQRLVAATQDGHVLLFEDGSTGNKRPFLCTSPFGCDYTAEVTEVSMMGLVAGDDVASQDLRTAALGPFPHAVNFAVPSPDGSLLALCMDAKELYLLAAKDWYSVKQKTVLSFAHIAGKDARVLHASQAGSQYCAFSPSSKYLAATSDLTFSAIVWDLSSGDLLFHVGTNRPSLAISFAASHEELLLFAESHRRLHVVDIRYPEEPHQVVTVAPAAPGVSADQDVQESAKDSPRITGLSVREDDCVFFSTVDCLYKYHLLPPAWSRSSHRHLPSNFKAVVKLMLLAASKDKGSRLWSMPWGALEKVIAMAAMPIMEWTGCGPSDSRKKPEGVGEGDASGSEKSPKIS